MKAIDSKAADGLGKDHGGGPRRAYRHGPDGWAGGEGMVQVNRPRNPVIVPAIPSQRRRPARS
jgi:hypothetical protein